MKTVDLEQGSTNSWILGSLCRGSGDGKRKWEERGGNFTTRTKNGVFALNSVYLQQEVACLPLKSKVKEDSGIIPEASPVPPPRYPNNFSKTSIGQKELSQGYILANRERFTLPSNKESQTVET